MTKLWDRYNPTTERGAKRKFETPQDMWDQACAYFRWCESEVLNETKLFKVKDGPQSPDRIESSFVSHVRPMTQAGLCAFVGMTDQTYRNYRKSDAYNEVAEMIDQIMFEQKFSGASVGLYNANIIGRELGLADRVEQRIESTNMTPWQEICGGENDS